MTKTFFTSDTHFGHEGLLRHGYRTFLSVEEMDNTIISRWNAVVGPRDVVWHLGDFTLSGAVFAQSILDRLNGQIHLVWGNHDRNSVRKLPRWLSGQYACEIRLNGRKLVLSHYAMRVWNDCRYGALMLYGHSHGSLPGNGQSLDVGVDCWNFSPVTLEEIEERMRTLPDFVSEDHHR
jgi:calcineurin-like phosphoesterase family protein